MDISEEPKNPIIEPAEASEQIIALQLRLASLEEQGNRVTTEAKVIHSKFRLNRIIWIFFVETIRLLAEKAVKIIYSKKRS